MSSETPSSTDYWGTTTITAAKIWIAGYLRHLPLSVFPPPTLVDTVIR